MFFLVDRDAVGHDDAPQPRIFRLDETATLEEALALVGKACYLPALPGGRATWAVEGERSLAVVTQEYREPWPLAPLATPLIQVAGRLPQPHLRFRFFPRRSPEEVLRELGGDPVRLSREAWEASAEISWSEAFRRFFNPR